MQSQWSYFAFDMYKSFFFRVVALCTALLDRTLSAFLPSLWFFFFFLCYTCVSPALTSSSVFFLKLLNRCCGAPIVISGAHFSFLAFVFRFCFIHAFFLNIYVRIFFFISSLCHLFFLFRRCCYPLSFFLTTEIYVMQSKTRNSSSCAVDVWRAAPL